MTKKITSAILALAMLFMTACGDSSTAEDSKTVESAAESASDSSERESDSKPSGDWNAELITTGTETKKTDSTTAKGSDSQAGATTTTKSASNDNDSKQKQPQEQQKPQSTQAQPRTTQGIPKTPVKPAQTTKTTTKTTTTAPKTTTKVTSTQPTDNKYMAAMKKISKVNAHINKDFTESDCALVREYLIDLVYKKYPKSKAHNVKFIPYFDKNGKPSYYDNVLNNGGSYNGANWKYYYGIDEGQIQMFIDEMTYLADVYMYNFDGEPCINGCTNWDIFWTYRSDGVVFFSLAVF